MWKDDQPRQIARLQSLTGESTDNIKCPVVALGITWCFCACAVARGARNPKALVSVHATGPYVGKRRDSEDSLTGKAHMLLLQQKLLQDAGWEGGLER